MPIYSSRPSANDNHYARFGGTDSHWVPVQGTEEAQAVEARFRDLWAQELENQGWLDRP